MNSETVTVEDCVEKYCKKHKITILNDGKVIGFQEEIPTQTANPSGDE